MKKTNKQNIETIVLENSKTGETLELQGRVRRKTLLESRQKIL